MLPGIPADSAGTRPLSDLNGQRLVERVSSLGVWVVDVKVIEVPAPTLMAQETMGRGGVTLRCLLLSFIYIVHSSSSGLGGRRTVTTSIGDY